MPTATPPNPTGSAASTGREVLAELEQLGARAAELQREVEASSRLVTLGGMAGLIAHEFKNLMTPMVGYARLALDHPDDAELTRKALERAAVAGERAGQIAASLLSLGLGSSETTAQSPPLTEAAAADQPGARRPGSTEPAERPEALSASRPIIETRSVGSGPTPAGAVGPGSEPDQHHRPRAAVGRVLDEALLCLGRPLDRDGIAFSAAISPGLWVGAEPAALQQVLMNLLLNARRAVPRGRGRIAVMADLVPTSTPTDQAAKVVGPGCSTWNGPWARIDVLDNGPGVRETHRPRLFEPAWAPIETTPAAPSDPADAPAPSAPPTTPAPAPAIAHGHPPAARPKPAEAPGHGLGLYVSRCLITAAGGRLMLLDDGHTGCRFRIELPAAGAAARAA